MNARRSPSEAVRPVPFRFDGQDYEGMPGEALAVALMRAGVRRLGMSPDGRPRGLFCGMGVCQDCVVVVEGRRVEACRLTLRAGLSADPAR